MQHTETRALICLCLWRVYINDDGRRIAPYDRDQLMRKGDGLLMNMDERIARINELYHKSQAEGLTEAEREEQARLRREYVESVRANLKGQLDNIVIERPDGSTEDLGAQRSKREIRRAALAARDGLSGEERKRGSLLLTERILGHQWFYGSSEILCYVSCGSEISTREIMEEALRLGKRVYVPKVLAGSEPAKMQFYEIDSLEKLKEGYKGIPEPEGNTESYEYTPGRAEHTLMLMPGVAFDRRRNRIGYGGGFYDRYLADKEVLKLRTIAVGFQCQMAEEIPAEAADVRPCQVLCM